ncbi:hypothetical protein PVAP13_J683244 [Panicum virgatum]|nr:hypothetical protein PVAP13_J683244 [Panicum virgatum]
MAKILLLVSLLYITIAEAAPIPAEWSATASKSINAMKLKLAKALDEVVLAAPPPKRSEVKKATTGHMKTIDTLLAKARATGDEKKAIRIASSYEEAADLVIMPRQLRSLTQWKAPSLWQLRQIQQNAPPLTRPFVRHTPKSRRPKKKS